MNNDRIIGKLKKYEGFRSKMYKCTEGFWTIGYGFNLEAGMNEEEASLLLRYRVSQLQAQLGGRVWFARLDHVRQEVIVQMAYQLGVGGVDTFRRMIGAISQGDYEKASAEMLDSRWAAQTPSRAKEMAKVMKHGTWEVLNR